MNAARPPSAGHTPNVRQRMVLAGLALLAFVLRVWRLDYQSLWRDEVDAVIFASRSLAEALDMFRRVGENGPLYFLGLNAWIDLAGQSEFAVRFPSACCGVLAVLLTYQLGRALLGRQIALIGALLLAASPYHIWYGQEAKMYALISFLAPLSLFVLLRARRGGGRWLWLAWAALMGVFLYVHLFALMMVLVAALWIPLLRPLRRPRLSPPLVIAILVVVAAALPVARWLVPAALTPVETGYYRYGLGEMVAILLRAFSMGLRPAGGLWPVALYALLFALGCIPLATFTAEARRTQRTQRRAEETTEAQPALERGSPGRTQSRAGEATDTPDRARRARQTNGRGSSVASVASVLSAASAASASARAVLLILLYLAAPLAAIWLVSLRRPTFTDRYLIITLPAFFLMIATGITVVAQAVEKRLAPPAPQYWGEHGTASTPESRLQPDAHGWRQQAGRPPKGSTPDRRVRRIAAARPGIQYAPQHAPPAPQPWGEHGTASRPPGVEALAGAGPPAEGSTAGRVAPRAGERWIAAALVVVLLLTAAPFVWAQTHNPYKADFRAATRYLTSQASPDDLVLFVMPYVQRSFSYYHPEPVRSAEPPYTRGMSAAQVDAALRPMVAGVRKVWLFLSEAEFWDEKGQIAAWFERNAVRRCQQQFAYIEVRCYEIK